jgi:hypothetical protein
MLTISKPLSAGQAQTYHQKEFTAKEQNYWSQQGVIAGEWQGRLAAQFGLAGAVSAEDFAKLSQGQHPQSGEQLVRQRASHEYQDAEGKTIKTMEHRAGWDATFSAPKSVSLTALVGSDDRVREAHRESVRVALDQLEHYTQARIGGNHHPKPRASFLLPSLSTIRLAPLMDMSRRNCTLTRSFSTSRSATTVSRVPSSLRASLPRSNLRRLSINPS